MLEQRLALGLCRFYGTFLFSNHMSCEQPAARYDYVSYRCVEGIGFEPGDHPSNIQSLSRRCFFSIFPFVLADMFCCIRIHLLAQAYLRLLPLHTILSCSKSSNPTTPTLSKSTFDWIILQTRSNLPVNQTLCSLHFNLNTTVNPVNCKSLQGRGCSPLFFCKVC